jgi:hypothetical protein
MIFSERFSAPSFANKPRDKGGKYRMIERAYSLYLDHCVCAGATLNYPMGPSISEYFRSDRVIRNQSLLVKAFSRVSMHRGFPSSQAGSETKTNPVLPDSSAKWVTSIRRRRSSNFAAHSSRPMIWLLSPSCLWYCIEDLERSRRHGIFRASRFDQKGRRGAEAAEHTLCRASRIAEPEDGERWD